MNCMDKSITVEPMDMCVEGRSTNWMKGSCLNWIKDRIYKGGERERGIKGYIRTRLKKSLDVGLNCISLEFGCI